MTKLEEKIYEFVKNYIQKEGKTNFTVDSELIESRVLTSLSLINLLTELEDKWNIDFKFEEIELESLTTIKGIVELTARMINCEK